MVLSCSVHQQPVWSIIPVFKKIRVKVRFFLTLLEIQWITKRFNVKAVKSSHRKYFLFLKEIRSFSIIGSFKYLVLKLRGKSILVTGSCRGCGTCCRSICLEGRNGWLRSKKDFQKIVGKYPEYNRFEIIGKDQQGFLLFSCLWSTPEGTCMDYDNRLPLCSKFPESSLVFAGGRLPVNCGYGFTEVVPFEKILRKELKKKK
jgi:Fe-S-cluster containining protein